MALKMTIEGSDGTKHEMDARVCAFCGGSGAMRETKRYVTRHVDEDEDVERTAILGERCPVCIGRGMVGVVGGSGG